MDSPFSTKALKEVVNFLSFLLFVEQIRKFALQEPFEVGYPSLTKLVEELSYQIAEISIVEGAMTNVLSSGIRNGSNVCGDMKARFTAFDQAMTAQLLESLVIRKHALLDGIQGEDFGPGEISVRQEGAAVIFINEATLNAQCDMPRFGEVEVGQGKITIGLAFPHNLANAEAHCVDHAKSDHRFREETISITPGRAVAADIIVGRSIEELARVLEDKLAGPFNDEDALGAIVILVGDAIVQGFENNPLIVFGDFNGNQLTGGQKGQPQIADFLKEAGTVEKKGRMEVFVAALRAFQFPGEFRNVRVQ